MKRLSAPVIRAASPGDATTIAQIKVAAWRAAYRGIVPNTVLDRLDIELVRDHWLGVSASELAHQAIVAVKNRSAVGYTLFGVARHPIADFDGQIFEIYVLPEQFGSGLAACLLDVALTRLKEGGRMKIILWVFEANTRARRFYEKHGWAQIENAELFTEIGGARLREVAYGFHLANTLK